MTPRFLTIFVLALTMGVAHADSDPVNRLAGNPSPYLAMHGQDPVHWQEWGEEAVNRAQRENKLLFVSIGYFACHWCHVMQKESYRNEEIAGILNRHYISVKVDRELNPALDARLIEFVDRTRGYSGWPLNVFITPEGYPLLGIVYLPPDNFKSLLNELAGLWKEDSAQLTADAKAATEGMRPGPLVLGRPVHAKLARDSSAALVKAALTRADTLSGGFGNQTKFPSVPQLQALLEIQTVQPDDQLGKFLLLTLDSMAYFGLNDNLGGGFFRYTVDPQWRVPHFEKMLYDNALLARLYLRAAEVFNAPRYEKVARATLDFMMKDLATNSGALVASLSAIDDKNIEGGYYLWGEDELQKILSKQEWRIIKHAWQVYGSPTTEDGYLPLAIKSYKKLAAELSIDRRKLQQTTDTAFKKLLKVRADRGLPVDDKRLAAWNGLALSAFARAAGLADTKKYKTAAENIRNYIVRELWDGTTLLRAHSKKGKPIGNSTFEDYAYVARGILDWAKVSGKQQDYAIANKLVRQAWQRFFSATGWQLSEKSLIAYGGGEAMLADGPMPSASGVLLEVSRELLERQDDENIREQMLVAIAAGQDLLVAEPYWFASHVEQVMKFQRP